MSLKTCEHCAHWETVDAEGTTICMNSYSPMQWKETSDGGSCHKWTVREGTVRCGECGWIGPSSDLGPEGECYECKAHGSAVTPI